MARRKAAGESFGIHKDLTAAVLAAWEHHGNPDATDAQINSILLDVFKCRLKKMPSPTLIRKQRLIAFPPPGPKPKPIMCPYCLVTMLPDIGPRERKDCSECGECLEPGKALPVVEQAQKHPQWESFCDAYEARFDRDPLRDANWINYWLCFLDGFSARNKRRTETVKPHHRAFSRGGLLPVERNRHSGDCDDDEEEDDDT